MWTRMATHFHPRKCILLVPMCFKKGTMGLEKVHGWAREIAKGLEAWAGGKYWDRQSRAAEAKKGWDRSLKRRIG